MEIDSYAVRNLYSFDRDSHTNSDDRSFGMHLLHQQCAKSDDEVIKLLQGHVDEVDGFLERTTEDFDLAQHDINERIRYLQLPLEHGDVFDNMLMDRSFRTAMVDGNVKIEHIVDRTSLALTDSLKDVKKGSDGTKELARYLRRLEKTWHGRDDAITEVFQAMMGNTEGWTAAFKELQDKGKELDKSLEHLRAIIAEIQRLVGIASRRDVPQQYTSTAAVHKLSQSRSSSRPMSPPRSQSPENGYNITSSPSPRTIGQDWLREQETEPDTLWSRTRTPPSLHPNAILEEDGEYEDSPLRQPTTNTPSSSEGRTLTGSSTATRRGLQGVAVGATTGVATGLGFIAAASIRQAQENESDHLMPSSFGRSGYSPQPEIIEEEEEEEDSDDSDYTIDIIDATHIKSAPVKIVAQDLIIRHEQSRSQVNETRKQAETQTPDYKPPKIEFESSIPRPTRDSIEEARKEFILPPLDLASETSLSALTPLDYERMRANFRPPPFDLQVPEEYTGGKQAQIDQPMTSPHPFQRKDNTADVLERQAITQGAVNLGKFQSPPIILPASTSLVSEAENLREEPMTKKKSSILPRKPVRTVDGTVPLLEHFHQKTDASSPKDTSGPDRSYQDSKHDGGITNAVLINGAAQAVESSTDSGQKTTPNDLLAQWRTNLKPIAGTLSESTSHALNCGSKAQLAPSRLEILQLSDQSFAPLLHGSEIPDQSQHYQNNTETRYQRQESERSNHDTEEALPISSVVVAMSTATTALPTGGPIHTGVPTLSKQPRQLPIDNLLVRLRHGNGLITPTEATSSIPAQASRSLVPTKAMQSPQTRITPSVDNDVAGSKPYTASQAVLRSGERQNIADLTGSELNHYSEDQNKIPESRNRLAEQLTNPKDQSMNSTTEQVIEIAPRYPTNTESFLRRRASYSDNRMTQRPAAPQTNEYARNVLLSLEPVTKSPKHYPHSARDPSSGLWTFFSKVDMDHSYRHRRAHSMFSPATPYDLEWLLRRTPSDAAVSPMRWSEMYGSKTGHDSMVSPMGDPLNTHAASFSPFKKDHNIGSVLAANKTGTSQSTTIEKLQRPNSLQIDLAIARGQLSQAAEIKPIQPSWKEPSGRAQKLDRSTVRASSVYSKAPDLLTVISPPQVSQIVRSETEYTSNYDDDSMPSSAYTDATFGQISPPPAISSAKPSPLHFVPKDRITSDPGSPSSPKEDPKFPAEISDEKYAVLETPTGSPSLKSLVSATITGPEPDFPFLAATYGGPEPDYYYPTEGVVVPSHRQVDRVPDGSYPVEPSKVGLQQPPYAQGPAESPLLNIYDTGYGQANSSKKREMPPPALNLKLFPSTDSVSRGPSSPRVPRAQDAVPESGSSIIPPSQPHLNLTGSNSFNPNLLALPPLAQEPMPPRGDSSTPIKSSRSPLKKLFKDALSPVLLAGKLKRDKDKPPRRGKNSSDNNLAKGATIAHAQFVPGHMRAGSANGNGSIDTTSPIPKGNPATFPDDRRPSGERVFYGAPGSDGRPF